MARILGSHLFIEVISLTIVGLVEEIRPRSKLDVHDRWGFEAPRQVLHLDEFNLFDLHELDQLGNQTLE